MTTINRIDVDSEGTLLVRFQKDDGGWHRTSFAPGEDVDFQMGRVNAHLQQLGQQPVADHEEIRQRAREEHTPARIANYRGRRGKPDRN